MALPPPTLSNFALPCHVLQPVKIRNRLVGLSLQSVNDVPLIYDSRILHQTCPHPCFISDHHLCTGVHPINSGRKGVLAFCQFSTVCYRVSQRTWIVSFPFGMVTQT